MTALWVAVIVLLIVNICLTLKIRRIERRISQPSPLPEDQAPWSPEGLQAQLDAQRQEDERRLELIQTHAQQMAVSTERNIRSIVDLQRQRYGV